jgi:hypothetical protein
LANHEKSHVVKIWNSGLEEEIQVELDSIKQEPKQWVLTYYDRMEKLFTRGKLEDVKHKKRFLFQLCLEIKKLCDERLCKHGRNVHCTLKEFPQNATNAFATTCN